MINVCENIYATTHQPEKEEIKSFSLSSHAILDKIDQYYSIERECDALYDQMEREADSICRRVRSELEKIGDIWTPSTERKSPKICWRASIARQFHVPYQVFGCDNMVYGASDEELAALEEMLARKNLLESRLQELETQIMAHLPNSVCEAVAKLKFLSALMIDGYNIDTDVFAYIVRESAEQIQYIQHGL